MGSASGAPTRNASAKSRIDGGSVPRVDGRTVFTTGKTLLLGIRFDPPGAPARKREQALGLGREVERR